MPAGRGVRLPSLRLLLSGWPWFGLALVLLLIRLSKGAGFNDLYALVSRPFWPGPAQSEWLRAAQKLDQQSRLEQLQADNSRLRELLGKGSWQGVSSGAAVVAPGGLLGRVATVTPSTATVQLLTDPGSRIGVWVARTKEHGLLVGMGNARPVLRFLDRDLRVRPGDLITTSPASTLMPPNLTVGVVQRLDERALPTPEAVVQLSAPINAVDWVQVVR